MCGIVGIVSKNDCIDNILSGLYSLEYRGYDSSGLATIKNNNFQYNKNIGKISNLEKSVKDNKITGNVVVAHTRWATHGIPSKTNAHPHSSGDVAVDHNGIIENYDELRKKLEKKNLIFESDTDTEVVAHLISYFLKKNLTPLKSTITALKKVEGAFALGIILSAIN